MCRLVGWVSEHPQSLASVLGAEALRRFTELSAVHGDGWGIAWRTPDGLEVRRSTNPARRDDRFTAAAHDIATTAAVVHLRWATPGFDVGESNTHPFLAADWAMAHNGSIGPSTAVTDLLTAEAAAGSGGPRGTTDSEHFFHGVLGSFPAAGADLVAAVERTSTRGALAGMGSSSLNSMFLRPAGLDVLSWHDPSQVPRLPFGATDPRYYDLRHRSTDGLDVVVSSGFVTEDAGWQLLPSASLTHVPVRGRSTRSPISPDRWLCPGMYQTV